MGRESTAWQLSKSSGLMEISEEQYNDEKLYESCI